MANWCFSNFTFFVEKDEDLGELKRLHKILTEGLLRPSEVKNSFEPGWLGKVAINHDICWESVKCRGAIEFIDDKIVEVSPMCFSIRTETAWEPMVELWEAVTAKYRGVSFVYLAEESGLGIFINTDRSGRFYTERYRLEVNCDDTSVAPSIFDVWGKKSLCEVGENEEVEEVEEVREAKESGENAGNGGSSGNKEKETSKKPKPIEVYEYFGSFDELQEYFAELTGTETQFSSVEEIQQYLDDIQEQCEGVGVDFCGNVYEYTYE